MLKYYVTMTTNDAMFVAKYNAVMCTILSLFLQSWAEADVISIEKNVSIDNTKIKMTHFLHENQLSHCREGNKKSTTSSYTRHAFMV